MAIGKNEAHKIKSVVPNSIGLKSSENTFFFTVVKMKKATKKQLKTKHASPKTVDKLIDELLKIDAKLLKKLS